MKITLCSKFYTSAFIVISTIPLIDVFYFGLFNEKRVAQILLLTLCVPYILQYNYRLLSSRTKIAIIILFLTSIISVSLSNNYLYSTLFFLHYFLLTGVILVSSSTSNKVNYLYTTSIIISLFLSGLFFLNCLFFIIDNKNFNYDGVFTGFYNIMFYNHFQVSSMIFSLFFINNEKLKNISLLTLTFNFLIIFISSARGALLSIILTIALGIYLQILTSNERKFILKSLLISITLYFAYLFIEPSNFTNQGLLRETTSGRFSIWKDVITEIDFKSALFGNGAGTFYSKEHGVSHPHNSILSLIYDWGLVVTFIVVFYFIKLIKESLKYIKSTKKNINFNISFLSLTALLLLSLVSGTLVMPIPQVIICTSIGVLAAHLKYQPSINKNKVGYLIYAAVAFYLILTAISFECQSTSPSGPNFWSNGQFNLSTCNFLNKG